MPGLCTYIGTATRNKVNINRNLCKICGKQFHTDSFCKNSDEINEDLYENTTEILQEIPIYESNFNGDQTFSNYDSEPTST